MSVEMSGGSSFPMGPDPAPPARAGARGPARAVVDSGVEDLTARELVAALVMAGLLASLAPYPPDDRDMGTFARKALLGADAILEASRSSAPAGKAK